MRFGFVSVEESFVPFARRLQDEGHRVVFLGEKESKVGDGIVSRVASPSELASSSDVVVFDGSGEGRLADTMRQTLPTIGGGTFCDKIEKERSFGLQVASECGIALPPYKSFSTVGAAIGYLNRVGEGEFYFKTNKFLESDATHGGSPKELVDYLTSLRKRFGNDVKNIIQKKIDGTAFSTAFWWNGHHIAFPIEGSIEHKKYLTGDLGPSTGCALNIVWFYGNDSALRAVFDFDRIEKTFAAYNAPPGMFDMNCIIHDRVPYFLEWCGRFGYDSEPTGSLLIADLGEHYYKLATGRAVSINVSTSAKALGIRLSIPPYPWELFGRKKSTEGTVVGIPANSSLWKDFVGYGLQKKDGRFSMATEDGIVGLAVARGDNLETLGKRVLAIAKKVNVPSLGYRVDAVEVLAKDLKAVRPFLGGT